MMYCRSHVRLTAARYSLPWATIFEIDKGAGYKVRGQRRDDRISFEFCSTHAGSSSKLRFEIYPPRRTSLPAAGRFGSCDLSPGSFHSHGFNIFRPYIIESIRLHLAISFLNEPLPPAPWLLHSLPA
jgi:hypothetical protein